jgi:tRNA A37 methylthiotransferase MiaB
MKASCKYSLGSPDGSENAPGAARPGNPHHVYCWLSWETEAEFQALLDFVDEVRFDRVGAFQFSFEPGTSSEALGDPIPAQVKQERYARLMEKQQAISLARNQALVGKTLDVLIEGQGNGISLGRSYRDAPEIDGVIVEVKSPLGDDGGAHQRRNGI